MIRSLLRPLWPLLLLPALASSASAEMLFQVSRSSAATPTDFYSTSCRISSTGFVQIERSVWLWGTPDTLRSVETKNVKISLKTLRSAIEQLSYGNISGDMLVGGGAHMYLAYQQQKDGSRKEIIISDEFGGLHNDSPLVKPLKTFIDGVCGQIPAPGA